MDNSGIAGNVGNHADYTPYFAPLRRKELRGPALWGVPPFEKKAAIHARELAGWTQRECYPTRIDLASPRAYWAMYVSNGIALLDCGRTCAWVSIESLPWAKTR